MNQIISQEEKYTPEAYKVIIPQKHKLIKASFNAKRNILKSMNFINLGGNQDIYYCDCPIGWVSMTTVSPIKDFELHIKQSRGELNV